VTCSTNYHRTNSHVLQSKTERADKSYVYLRNHQQACHTAESDYRTKRLQILSIILSILPALPLYLYQIFFCWTVNEFYQRKKKGLSMFSKFIRHYSNNTRAHRHVKCYQTNTEHWASCLHSEPETQNKFSWKYLCCHAFQVLIPSFHTSICNLNRSTCTYWNLFCNTL